MIYVAYYKPFKKSLDNKKEIFNEVCILLVAYTLFIFTDFQMDIIIKSNVGYLLICIVVLNIVVNGYFIFRELAIFIWRKYKAIQYYYKLRKLKTLSAFHAYSWKHIIQILVNDKFPDFIENYFNRVRIHRNLNMTDSSSPINRETLKVENADDNLPYHIPN